MTLRINAIIAQYIASETRIIIPDVGTLIRRKEKGEIVFMEMLKKNDGVLSNLVMNTLDVSPSKSAEIIKDYVAEIQQQLTNSKKFILDGVGVLLARPEGGIGFSFNPFAKSIPEPGKKMEIIEEVAPVAVEEAPVATEEREAPVAEATQSPAESKVVAPVATPTPKVAQPKEVKPAEPKEVKPAEPVAKPAPKPITKPIPKPTVKPTPKPIWEIDEPEETPRKPRISGKRKRIKIDGLTIIAIIAVIMAILTLVWGLASPEQM